MLKLFQRPIVVPAAQIAVHRSAWRQVFQKSSPLAACAENINHPVDHRPNVDRSLVARLLARLDQQGDQRLLLVRQISRIPQLAAVISRSGLRRPHPAYAANCR